MTAGIFAQHGVWVGNSKPGNQNNPRGNFENLEIKRFLINKFGRLSNFSDIYSSDFKNLIEKLNPPGAWLVKHGALYWSVWRDFKPKWIYVRRDPNSILESCRNVNFHGHDENYINANIESMDQCKKINGGVDIETAQLIEGNYDSLVKAFDYCGLNLDMDKVKSFIDPGYWHY